MANQKSLGDLQYLYFSSQTGGGAGLVVATQSNVGDAAASTTILAANVLRKGAAFYNISTAILYLRLDGGVATATTGFSVAIPASTGYFELPQPCITGLITGIWASDAGGSVNVTEWV